MSELDTFVQLFAAFYVTLSVENQIFRQFLDSCLLQNHY